MKIFKTDRYIGILILMSVLRRALAMEFDSQALTQLKKC